MEVKVIDSVMKDRSEHQVPPVAVLYALARSETEDYQSHDSTRPPRRPTSPLSRRYSRSATKRRGAYFAKQGTRSEG